MMARQIYWIVGVYLLYLAGVPNLYSQSGDVFNRQQMLDEVRARLVLMLEEVRSLEGEGFDVTELEKNRSIFKNEQVYAPEEKQFDRNVVKQETSEGKSFDIGFGEDTDSSIKGFYILPFFGFQKFDLMKWKTFAGNLDVEQSDGLSTGLRLGYTWDSFFADLQTSYFKNFFKSIDIPFGLSGDFSGESRGLGVHLSSGAKFHFYEMLAWVFGAGIGGVNQEVSILYSGLSEKERKFLFSYHFFTGLELRPIESLIIELRYRWMNVGEMDLFSARNLQSIELATGYVF